MNKSYPVYIFETVRQRLGLDKDDPSLDVKILNMSEDQIFSHVVNWNGLLGYYDSTIKNWVKDIYNVNLGKSE